MEQLHRRPLRQAIHQPDPVTLHDDPRWSVRVSQSRARIMMKAGWSLPEGQRVLSAEVGAIVPRRAHESTEEYRAKLKRQSWEIVLPEIVLEAG